MLLTFALRNLLRNPRRTLAVLFTVALGGGSLFLLHGFNTGIMNQYRDNTIHARYGNGQIATAGYRTQVFARPWEHWIEDPARVERALRELPAVTHVFPRLELSALLSSGEVSVSGRGQGVRGPEEAAFFTTLNVVQGAPLGAEPDGILLGKGLADALRVGPGGRVRVTAADVHGGMRSAELTVSGVFHTGLKEFDDVLFRLPLEKAQALLDTRAVETLALGLRSVDDWPAIAALVRARFPRLEATAFDELDRVYYQHSVDWLSTQFRVIQLVVVLIVTLGIVTTISNAVLERRQEIGNLRANGESVGEVLRLLALEGVALGAVGALAGLLLGLLLSATVLHEGILMPPAPGITRQFRVRIELQAARAISTFGLCVVATAAGTLLAGIRTARLPIGEALRDG